MYTGLVIILALALAFAEGNALDVHNDLTPDGNVNYCPSLKCIDDNHINTVPNTKLLEEISGEPSSDRNTRWSLLAIDPQNDFITGSLKVPGADEDLSRTISFLESIDQQKIRDIFVTLDTHGEDHIAHDPSLLTYPDGSYLPDFTTVTVHDIESGTVLVKTGMEKIFLQYLKDLEERGKYQYTKWPPHCVKGTDGHLVPSELRDQLVTWPSVQYIEKGSNRMTEMYSALSAEVPQENDPSTQLNTDLINSLNENDYVIVFGQAKSHCVKATVEDYLDHIGPNTKIILLNDLTSSVPGFDHLGTELEETLISKGHIVSTSTSDEVSLLLR